MEGFLHDLRLSGTIMHPNIGAAPIYRYLISDGVGFVGGRRTLRELFWERLSLGELNKREWEALCDGCGQCCLVRHVEANTVTVYGVACELLDIEKARCKDYPKRLKKVANCHQLTPENVPRYHWLPKTCSYRLVHQGKSLPSWHPLLIGSRKKMRKKGITVSDYALPSREVPRRRLNQHIVERWSVPPERPKPLQPG